MERSQDRRVSLCIPWPLLMDHPGQKRKLGKVIHRYSSLEALTKDAHIHQMDLVTVFLAND
jgi:hypothetical protein